MENTDELIQNWPRVLLGFLVLLLVGGVAIASARQYLRQSQPGDITPPGVSVQENQKGSEEKKEAENGDADAEEPTGKEEQPGEKIEQLPYTSAWQVVTVKPGDGWERIARRACGTIEATEELAAQNPTIKTLYPGMELRIKCP